MAIIYELKCGRGKLESRKLDVRLSFYFIYFHSPISSSVRDQTRYRESNEHGWLAGELNKKGKKQAKLPKSAKFPMRGSNPRSLAPTCEASVLTTILTGTRWFSRRSSDDGTVPTNSQPFPLTGTSHVPALSIFLPVTTEEQSLSLLQARDIGPTCNGCTALKSN